LVSCKKDTEPIKSEIAKKDSAKTDILITEKKEKSEIENARNQVRYFFSANGGSILYLKNGDVKGQARFDTDGDFISELMKTKTYGKYKEFDDYLIEVNSNVKTNFFEEFGKIDGSWKILKGVTVENQMQVFSYQSPKNPSPEEIETVSETRLIIFSPETKTFKDENSEEAETYFIAMDDWNWYSHELNENFEKMGIKSIYLKKPYLKLNIENNEEIIIDTEQEINNHNAQALLYIKGKRPLIIHLITSDNNLDEIKKYLK
jgi:hypothetical protein